MPPGGNNLISNNINQILITNEVKEGQRVKAVTFKLPEPLHNLDGAMCGLYRARPEGKTSLTEVIF